MAAWALSLLRVEAFVLTRAVRRCAGSVSGPNKSLLQRMPLWLTGFHLRTYLFHQLRLQSLRNSLCLFSKQAIKYTLLYFLFHKKTRAEQTCVNKPVGAPLAVGSQQQQGHHFQISSQLCSKQQGAKQQTQCGKSRWWGLLYEKMLSLCPVDIGHGEARQRPVCELSPTLSWPHFTEPNTVPLQSAEVGTVHRWLLYEAKGGRTSGFLRTFLESLGLHGACQGAGIAPNIQGKTSCHESPTGSPQSLCEPLL